MEISVNRSVGWSVCCLRQTHGNMPTTIGGSYGLRAWNADLNSSVAAGISTATGGGGSFVVLRSLDIMTGQLLTRRPLPDACPAPQLQL